MPQLLLEFFSEEIPARMQKRAEEDLARALGEKLKGAGLEPKVIRTFSSPRRIGAVIDELPAKAADVNEEKKGPRVGAPEQAIQGFLKSAGLKRLEDAQIVEDKKGAFYVAKIERAGRETPAILQEIVPEIVRAFPWPKSMRSGESDLTWVRPLQNILCLFGGAHVEVSVDGVPSEAKTWGHRFHAPAAIEPKDFADYAAKLRAAKVEIDREARKLCAAKKLELVEDIGLLEEVAGLVEWPVVLLGDMNPAFLDLPAEVIRLSMRTHQKYFAVRDAKGGKLAPHFVTVANVEAKDGGNAIAAGNARVLSARLNDARFFWDTDKKTPLYTDARRDKLKQIVFHQNIGSIWQKVERTSHLAGELCIFTKANQESVFESAKLSKCDLVTETVGEFPELQGQIGRQLALLTGVPAVIAQAIEDHYRPLGPYDRVPNDPVSITLALADKIDSLVAFWAIEERPTGSSDPYALRRAALGVVSLVLANRLKLPLRHAIQDALKFSLRREMEVLRELTGFEGSESGVRELLDARGIPHARVFEGATGVTKSIHVHPSRFKYAFFDPGTWAYACQGVSPFKEHYQPEDKIESLIQFIVDRLKVQLRDQGKRHDLVDAVFALGDDDLVRIVARVEALDAFLKSQDGANLLAGYKRAANILAAEEKKGKGLSDADIAKGLDASLLKEPAEKALYDALEKALPAARTAVEKEDFAAAMKALSQLRAPVDAFFDGVLVNAEDAALRRNRLLLLSRLREALSAVADFSKIEG